MFLLLYYIICMYPVRWTDESTLHGGREGAREGARGGGREGGGRERGRERGRGGAREGGNIRKSATTKTNEILILLQQLFTIQKNVNNLTLQLCFYTKHNKPCPQHH